MKKFISKFLLLSIPILGFICTSVMHYIWQDQKVRHKLDEISKYDCLLMGDSQIQRLNAEYFSIPAYNLANSAEHFFFTYQKLKKILQSENSNVKKIVLGVSIHSFSSVYNRLFDINLPEGKNSLKRYLYFIDDPDKKDFAKLSQLKSKDMIISVYQKPDWGGLVESNHSNPDLSIIHKMLHLHFAPAGSEKTLSQSQQIYFRKIDKICEQNNIELYICTLPYCRDYLENIPSENYRFYIKTTEEYEAGRHIDFLNDSIDPGLMSDAVHLNKKGALYYSSKVDKIIRSSSAKLPIENNKAR